MTKLSDVKSRELHRVLSEMLQKGQSANVWEAVIEAYSDEIEKIFLEDSNEKEM